MTTRFADLGTRLKRPIELVIPIRSHRTRRAGARDTPRWSRRRNRHVSDPARRRDRDTATGTATAEKQPRRRLRCDGSREQWRCCSSCCRRWAERRRRARSSKTERRRAESDSMAIAFDRVAAATDACRAFARPGRTGGRIRRTPGSRTVRRRTDRVGAGARSDLGVVRAMSADLPPRERPRRPGLQTPRPGSDPHATRPCDEDLLRMLENDATGARSYNLNSNPDTLEVESVVARVYQTWRRCRTGSKRGGFRAA